MESRFSRFLSPTSIYWVVFRREFSRLSQAESDLVDTAERRAVPWSITLIHLLFLVWTVINAHYPVLGGLGFLFFLAFVSATRHNQQGIALRPPVVWSDSSWRPLSFMAAASLGGSAPCSKVLANGPLMICATVLTAFNDNAAITYLATLVPGFSDASRYAVMAGAISGGGLYRDRQRA